MRNLRRKSDGCGYYVWSRENASFAQFGNMNIVCPWIRNRHIPDTSDVQAGSG
jgi:hypothetical protein